MLTLTDPLPCARHCAKGSSITETQSGRYQYYVGSLNNLPMVGFKSIPLIILLKSKPTQDDLRRRRKVHCYPLNICLLYMSIYTQVFKWICSKPGLDDIHSLTSLIYSLSNKYLFSSRYHVNC